MPAVPTLVWDNMTATMATTITTAGGAKELERLCKRLMMGARKQFVMDIEYNGT